MVDVFVSNICCYCSNNNCSKSVEIVEEKGCTTYRCKNYKKDKKKIVPYQEPLIVTAERDYVTKKER